DACAPLARDAAAFAALNAAVLEHGRSAGWKYLEWRGEASLGPDAKPSLTYWQHAIDLVADEDKQFATLKAPVRTAVRKAIGAGVQVEVSTSIDAVRAFHALNGVTRKRHGLPPQPWKFFANLQRHVLEAEQGVVVAARFEGRPVAASVYLFHGRRAVYKYGASDAAFQHLRANDLVMWEALRWFGRQGFTELSLGKTALEHEGLRRFKQGWGARESELLYYKYDYKGGGFVRDRDDVTGWHNRVFRVLPISLSRVVGNALYRHAG
ncbi:MAG TPA: GNAT family N-acetyltransferase, partial [Kiritimatiellia bacterium]